MPFIRSFVLARLLAPDQFGLAIALTTIAGLVELASDTGMDRSALRSQNPAHLTSLHLISVVRGTVLATVLFASGPFLAGIFKVPEAHWAFSALALASLIRGFAHLGVKRAMRHHNYWPDSVATGAAQIAWTAIMTVVAIITDDYRCMLAGIIGGQLVYVWASHQVAAEPWRIGWDKVVGREAIRYGLPLVPNGIAIALRSLGDRALVGALLELREMATYTIVVTAATLPRRILLRLVTTVFTSSLVKSGSSRQDSRLILDTYAAVLALFATFYAVSFIAVGRPLVTLVFGSAFEPNQKFVDLVAVDVAVRFLFELIVAPALAFGFSGLVLVGSLGGLLALASGAVLLSVSGSLVSFIAGILAVETLTLIYLTYVAGRRFHFTPAVLWISVFGPLLLAVATIQVFALLEGISVAERIVTCFAMLAFSAVALPAALRLGGLPLKAALEVVFRPRGVKPASHDEARSLS